MKESLKQLGSFDNQIFGTLVGQGSDMITKYWNEVVAKVQPILVEEKFEIALDKFPNVIIYGFVDLVTEDGWIVDHKNCGESNYKNWNQKSVDSNLQLTLYYLWYMKTYKKRPAGVRIDALKRLKKGPEIEMIESTRDTTQILSLVHLMDIIKKMQESDLMFPNYNHCIDCDYDSECTKLCK